MEQDNSFNIDLVQLGVSGQRGRLRYGASIDFGDLAKFAGDSADGDIALQALLHMGVGLGVVPATGLALPLVSYGRSNLLVTLVALGILISVARAAPGGKMARV